MFPHRPWTARPTISVLCPTAHPGPLVADALGPLRDVVDEIIIAADSRVKAADLGHYAAVADVLLRFEYRVGNRHWPWLAAQARGDWLFLLDGDELPSTALIAALRELAADRRVRQYVLPIHWLWPDSSRRLTEEPWCSDHRLRLIRNDGRLTFGAQIHVLAEPDPPMRFFDELPVYHLDLLLQDRTGREAKAASYDGGQFGLLTPEGLPFNEAYYLPESHAGERATVELPVEDAEAAERSLRARYDSTLSLDPATVPLHDKAAVVRYARRASLPADAYRGALSFARPLPPFTAERRDHTVWVYVTNEGTARWPNGDSREPLIRVGVAWQPAGGGPRYEVGRAFLPHTLDPGERTLVPVEVCGPPSSGPAELVLDLVHEHVRWFDCALTAPVDVGRSASERLSALAEKHGPLLPLSEVMQERREVGGHNGLLRDPAPGATPTDRRIAKLMRGLELDEQGADAETIDRLVELVRSKRPAAVVEFGSGTSTVVLAALMAKLHRDGPRIVSFEQSEERVAWARKQLAGLGLDQMVELIHLPVGVVAPDAPMGYVANEGSASALRARPPELIFVDGPTLDSGASRLGTVDLVAPFVRKDAVLLLDDAFRDAELRIAAAWDKRPEITIHGIRPTARGLLEATLRAVSAA